jgi:hypothetical protein
VLLPPHLPSRLHQQKRPLSDQHQRPLNIQLLKVSRNFQVDLQEDELILGVAIDGQAKAYPITVLRSREMVNDELAGIPLLVTW